MTGKEKIRVAAVQIAPDLDTPTGTLDRVLAATSEAAAKGARLVVFPETFVPWYPYFSFIRPPMLSGAEHIHLYDNAVVVPGPVTEAVSAAARQHNMVVVLGVNERDHGTLYNAQLIFNADGSAGAEAPQDHADLSRADDLGPGRRRRTEGGRYRGRAGSARWPAGSITIRSPATR